MQRNSLIHKDIINQNQLLRPDHFYPNEYADYACFAYDVYGVPGLKLPNGYLLVYTSAPDHSGPDGYYGQCYTKVTPNDKWYDISVVFAHRGTVIDWTKISDSVGDIIGDIETAMGFIPLHIAYAHQFIKKSIDDIKNLYKDKIMSFRVVNVGHSLGAIISDGAAHTTAYEKIVFYPWSFTFDNPGSKPILMDLIKAKKVDPNAIENAKQYGTIVAFQGDINIINTCNEQTGSVVKLYSYYQNDKNKKLYNDFFKQNPDMPIPVPSSYLFSLCGLVSFFAFFCSLSLL